jgi:hypothetical protein
VLKYSTISIIYKSNYTHVSSKLHEIYTENEIKCQLIFWRYWINQWVFLFLTIIIIYSNLEIYGRIKIYSQYMLLGEILRYDLYYSLPHHLKWKSFGPETYTDSHYLMINFYQINEVVRFKLVIAWLSKL